MVRLCAVLLRVPVIKFRKGGLSQSGSGAAGPAAAAAPAAAPAGPTSSCAFKPAGAPAGAPAMSTSAIPDVDLPARYRRKPLSEEEIEKINGGGIV